MTATTGPIPESAPAAPEDVFGSLGDFFIEHLAPMYAVQTTDSLDATWCPEWWLHPAAVGRLWVCWRSFEEAVRRGPGAMSSWMLNDCDRHMRELLDPTGVFRFCNLRHGHKDLIRPLAPTTREQMPAELFTTDLGEPSLAPAPTQADIAA